MTPAFRGHDPAEVDVKRAKRLEDVQRDAPGIWPRFGRLTRVNRAWLASPRSASRALGLRLARWRDALPRRARAIAFYRTLVEHRGAVQFIEKQLFDGNAILFKDIDAELNALIEEVAGAIATFNELMAVRVDPESRVDTCANGNSRVRLLFPVRVDAIRDLCCQHGPQAIATRWMDSARAEATSDLLERRGGHEAFMWD